MVRAPIRSVGDQTRHDPRRPRASADHTPTLGPETRLDPDLASLLGSLSEAPDIARPESRASCAAGHSGSAQAAHCTFPAAGDRSRRNLGADLSVAVRAWGLGRSSLRLAGRVPLPACGRLGGEPCGAPGCAAGGDTCGVSERSPVLPDRDDLRRLGMDIDRELHAGKQPRVFAGTGDGRAGCRQAHRCTNSRSLLRRALGELHAALGGLPEATSSGRHARCRRSRPRLAVELFADRLTLAAVTIFDEQRRGDVRKTGLGSDEVVCTPVNR
jgi:hypothetical protein